jgi:protein-S-isoprenylcysteine O-methyltransferase Ste14
MSNVFRYPALAFALSFFAQWLAARIGDSFRKKRRPLTEDERKDFGVVVAATLTLLGLIIGFSFSMAITRYDQRKLYEEAEANAIGTEYVRADLLPAGDGARVRELLKRYIDQRVLSYTTRDTVQLGKIDADTAQLQNELWSTVQGVAAVQRTPVVALTVSGMNDVLNAQGYTQAAWLNRIPVAAWVLMMAIAICCNLLIGIDAHQTNRLLLFVLPLLVSISFFLIADIDSPRRGIIRVVPQNLLALSRSLHPR